MSRVLFTWELGANFGHLSRQLPIAREVRRRGHEVLFAVCDVQVAQAALGGDGFAFVQTPFPRTQSSRSENVVVYAEILDRYGFGEVGGLRAGVAAWRNLFDLFRPDVIVADHAPLSMFAARMAQLPVVHVAIGFEQPPSAPLLPVLRKWLEPDSAQTAVLERELLERINVICDEHEQPLLARLSDLYETEVPLLSTFPELEHFPERRGGRYIGPLLVWNDGADVEWPQGDGKRIFVYVRPDAHTPLVLNALKDINARVIAVIPGLDEYTVNRFTSERISIHQSPVKLPNLLSTADLAVIPGGHGMICCCLLSGVPMLMVPIYVEQMLVTRCVERLGAGIGMASGQMAEKFASALDALLTRPQFRIAANKVAEKYKDYDQGVVVQRIANTIERLPAVDKRAHVTGATVQSAVSADPSALH